MDLYLLGAGFSSDAGVPTMKNFLQGVLETKAASLQTPVYPLLKRASDYAQKTGTGNIEDLLTAAANDPVFFDLIWAFGLTINFFSRRFLDRCRFGEDVGWYEDFAGIVSAHDTRILTFNYDLILEEVLWWRKGCVEDYSMPFNEIRHQPQPRHSPCAVPLYKLHGSISWLWCLHCLYIVNLYRHIIPAAYEEAPCPRCSFRLIPLMVPPTFRKAASLTASLQNLWQQADLFFAQAERIVIGGLSFSERDHDLRQRFQIGVAKNRQLKEVVLVNRDRDTCYSIASLLPRHIPWRAISGFCSFCTEFK